MRAQRLPVEASPQQPPPAVALPSPAQPELGCTCRHPLMEGQNGSENMGHMSTWARRQLPGVVLGGSLCQLHCFTVFVRCLQIYSHHYCFMVIISKRSTPTAGRTTPPAQPPHAPHLACARAGPAATLPRPGFPWTHQQHATRFGRHPRRSRLPGSFCRPLLALSRSCSAR